VLAGNGIRWNNQPGGVLDLLSSATWDYTGVGARPTFQNSGTVSNGVGFAPALNWTFTNSGLVWARAPQLNLTRGFTQIAGESVVDAAATLGIPGSSTALVLGGILEGTGTVGGNVANAGTVHPGNSPGILGIGGNFYTNLPGGRLAIDIGGRTAGTGYSQLQGVNTSTEAVLGGALDVSFVNGFVPALGDSFTIVAFPSVLAKTYFTSLNGLRSGNGLVLVPVYGPASVRLVAAQDPTLVSPAHSGNQFSFSFLTTAGLTNVVEYSDALVPPLWHVLTNVTGDGTAKLVVDPSATVSNRFYRVRFL